MIAVRRYLLRPKLLLIQPFLTTVTTNLISQYQITKDLFHYGRKQAETSLKTSLNCYDLNLHLFSHLLRPQLGLLRTEFEVKITYSCCFLCVIALLNWSQTCCCTSRDAYHSSSGSYYCFASLSCQSQSLSSQFQLISS